MAFQIALSFWYKLILEKFQIVRVAVFAEGPEAQEALAAGADVVGADDLVDRIKDSKF